MTNPSSGNSGPLPEPVVAAVESADLVCCGVLSGNRYTTHWRIRCTLQWYGSRTSLCRNLSLHLSPFLRNFEGRIHPHTRANYLASPLFVIAYAIAGRVDIDFETEPLATLDDGKQVLLLLICLLLLAPSELLPVPCSPCSPCSSPCSC